MFDNSMMGNMAKKALAKHFDENGISAMLIQRDNNGEFTFDTYEEPVKVITETELNNLVKQIINEP